LPKPQQENPHTPSTPDKTQTKNRKMHLPKVLHLAGTL